MSLFLLVLIAEISYVLISQDNLVASIIHIPMDHVHRVPNPAILYRTRPGIVGETPLSCWNKTSYSPDI